MQSRLSKIPITDEFNKGLWVSLGIHIFIILIFTVRAFFVKDLRLEHESAIRVDLVALPDKLVAPPTPEEIKNATDLLKKNEPVVSVEKNPTKPVPVEKALEQKQKEAIRKLKTLEAMDKIHKEIKKNQTVSNTKIKGNFLSPGTELTGVNRLQHDNYIASVDRIIKQNWSLPEWLARKNLRAQVRVKIGSKGQILGKQIYRSSGNPSYDEIVLETIVKSEPFPAPPEKFLAILEVNGILIGFPE